MTDHLVLVFPLHLSIRHVHVVLVFPLPPKFHHVIHQIHSVDGQRFLLKTTPGTKVQNHAIVAELIDEAGSRVRLINSQLPPAAKELDKELRQILKQKDDAVRGQDFEKAGELRDELMTLLFAGHETTATAMSWALYWTHRYPEIKAKILQEIATLGDNPNPIDITRLPYLSAVCSETLRIHPVGMLTFPRVVEKPVELDGYPLEKGTILMGCIYLAHHREQTFPDSHTFKPERFLEKQFTPYEYMPFGGGARRCIGEVLAIYEMKIAIATILANYQLTLVNNTPEKPSRRGLTLAPSRGVPMVLKGRREPLVTAPMLAEIS